MPFNWQINEFEFYSYLCLNTIVIVPTTQYDVLWIVHVVWFWLMREEHVRKAFLISIVQRLWYENLLTFISMILKVKQ